MHLQAESSSTDTKTALCGLIPAWPCCNLWTLACHSDVCSSTLFAVRLYELEYYYIRHQDTQGSRGFNMAKQDAIHAKQFWYLCRTAVL